MMKFTHRDPGGHTARPHILESRVATAKGNRPLVTKVQFSRLREIDKLYRIGTLNLRQAGHMLHLTANIERINPRYAAGTKHKAVLLLWDEQIAGVARRFARDISKNETHRRALPDGAAIQDRLSKAGIKWLSFGVNLGLSSGYPLAAHVAFMRGRSHHQNHRANILNPQFTRFGAGVAWSNGVFFVCEIFLEPAQK